MFDTDEVRLTSNWELRTGNRERAKPVL